jgi:histidine phosphotransferase ChpT
MSAAQAAEMSALLGSRICHDLVSPLGAVGNGLELLQMMGGGDSPEMSLVSESVETVAARVRLFRLAFGAATPDQSVSAAEMREHAAQLGSNRFRANWTSPEEIDRPTAKVGLLLLLCAETLLPFGGEARAEATADLVRLSMTADRMRDPERLLASLEMPEATLPAASEIHFPLARLAADGMGRRLAVTREGERTVIAA